MDFKPTRNSQEALTVAVRRAAADGNPQIDPLHLLAALLDQSGGIAASLLKAVGADPVVIANETQDRIARLSQMRGDTASAPLLSRQLLAVINTATNRAQRLKDDYVSTEHLLIGLAADGGDAATVLRNCGATADALTGAFSQVRGSAPVATKDSDGTYQALETYGTDLTRSASRGELDPVIGRDAEIRRVVLVLSRLTKNNPVLVGSRGVNKTAVVEGLAQRIVADDVPEWLHGKRLVALDLGAMMGGAESRGEFARRLKDVFSEIRQSEGRVITFIDDFQAVADAAAAEGVMDVLNMLKPMLARDEFRLIGTTTIDEYRKRIEQDPALERRFQQVLVKELPVADSIRILRQLKPRYEAHHQVQISDAALMAAAILSDRYVTDRFLPDKAIDLVDEAASLLRLEIDSGPVEIDELRRTIDRMKMEGLALALESDPASRKHFDRLRYDLADRQEQLTALLVRWEQEKSALDRVGELKEKLDDLKGQAERTLRDGDYETAARLLCGEVPALEAELSEASSAAWDNVADGSPMVKYEVGPDDIAGVVSAWTGIPADRLLEGETAGPLRVDDEPGVSDSAAIYTQVQAGPAQTVSHQTTVAGYAFLSYIRENSAEADRLQQVLEAAGIHVWRDTTDLWPGEDWHEKIRRAITEGSLVFLACFSKKSAGRETSYQNEELTLAVDQMRIRPPDRPWLIPIRFDDCEIPDLNLGGGRFLGSIQCADLFGDHVNDATARLVDVIHRVLKSRG